MTLLAFSGLCSIAGARRHATHSYTVHGTLAHAAGNSSYRIWLPGTLRVLAVHETPNEKSQMPKKLADLMSSDRDIVGDFLVQPVRPYLQGQMQIVRIISASNIVVEDNGQVVLKKAKL